MSGDFASKTQFWLNQAQSYIENGETWVYFKPIWVSSQGRACNPSGVLLNLNAQNKWTYKHEPFSRNKTMALAFKIKGVEKLTTEKNYVVTLIDSSKPCCIDNLFVGKRGEKMNEVIYQLKEEVKHEFQETDYVKLIPLHTQYALTKDGNVYNIKNPSRFLSYQNNGRNCFRYRDENDVQHIKYIDLIMCLLFQPFENLVSYEAYLEQTIIVHKNGKLLDDRLLNLEVNWKEPSKEQQRKINVIQRKTELRDKVMEWINYRNAKLVSPLETIDSVFSQIIYICKCESTFSKIIKDCLDSINCQQCLSRKIKNTEVKSDDDFTLNGEEFIKIEGGWVSKQGNFLNSSKQSINILKGYVNLLGKKINAKEIIALTFKLDNYLKLKTDSNYHVFKVNPNKGYEVSNLVISTQSSFKKGKKISSSQEHIVSKEEVENIEFLEWPYNPSYIFYKNGIVYSKKRDYYSKGYLKNCGYRQVQINNKRIYMHRAICFLFNPLPNLSLFEDYDHLEVDHINNKKVNFANNLRWVTSKENKKYGVEHNAYKSNKAVNVYYLLDDGTKGELIANYKTMKDTMEKQDIGKKKLSSLLKSGGGPWKEYFYEPIAK
jgi:hypothetical protein